MQDRPDFRVAIPLVKPPGQVIEVGHAYEEVLGPAKDHALQMGQERSAIPRPWGGGAVADSPRMAPEGKRLRRTPEPKNVPSGSVAKGLRPRHRLPKRAPPSQGG